MRTQILRLDTNTNQKEPTLDATNEGFEMALPDTQQNQKSITINLKKILVTNRNFSLFDSGTHFQVTSNNLLHKFLCVTWYGSIPVSQIASFNFFPPSVTYFTLKSTPAENK